MLLFLTILEKETMFSFFGIDVESHIHLDVGRVIVKFDFQVDVNNNLTLLIVTENDNALHQQLKIERWQPKQIVKRHTVVDALNWNNIPTVNVDVVRNECVRGREKNVKHLID
jgi:hypothetical protein